MRSTANNARIWAVIGASGTGKGLWIKSQLRALNPPRLLIVDPLDEYGPFATRLAPALGIVRAMAAPRWRLRYVPAGTGKQRAEDFEILCRGARAAGDCCILVEELSQWTQPSWAPPAWRDCCNMGRQSGLHIIGVSQFPALVDKSFLANATLFHCGALRQDRHRRAVAAELDISPDELRDMLPLHWIERDNVTGAITRGRVKAPRARARVVAPAVPVATQSP